MPPMEPLDPPPAPVQTPGRLSVAPMMNHTDRHFRMLLRLISRHTLLYTEMIPTGALLHGNAARRLDHDPAEHPLAIQLGGCDPAALAKCARIAESAGFCEINLNVGCPSDRVQEGRFGACMMAHPGLVGDCVAAMAGAVGIPVTVKTRIGIDHQDTREHLAGFVSTVSAAGCRTFIVHARKAWLQGLSPRDNRQVPPLQYPAVYRLKRDFPDLHIVINGGITTLDEAIGHLRRVDGVMIGRAVCSNPYLLHEADARLFGDPAPAPTRADVLRRYAVYAGRQSALGVDTRHIARHASGLFQGQPRARAFRRHLAEHAVRTCTGPDILHRALDLVAA
jgi:tRNA-dihydrouridine synthase A